MINPTKPPWMEFKWGTIEKKNPIFIFGIIGTREKYNALIFYSNMHFKIF